MRPTRRYMSRTQTLENAPKNRFILKIKEHRLLAGRRRRARCIRVRAESEGQREKARRDEREREGERVRVAAGVRLIVVSNRLYPGILIRSQLSALVAARDEQNVPVVRVYCEKRDSSARA